MPSWRSSLPRPRASTVSQPAATNSLNFRGRAGSASTTISGLPAPEPSRSVRRRAGLEDLSTKKAKPPKTISPLDLAPPRPLPLTPLPDVPPKLSRQASAPVPPSNPVSVPSRFLSERHAKPSSAHSSSKPALSSLEHGRPLTPATAYQAVELTRARTIVAKRNYLSRARSKCVQDWVADVSEAQPSGAGPSDSAPRSKSRRNELSRRQDWAHSFLRGKEALANTGHATLGLHDAGASTTSTSSPPLSDTQPAPISAGALTLAKANAKAKAAVEAGRLSESELPPAHDMHRSLLLDDTLLLLRDTEAQLDEALAVRDAADAMVDMLTDKLTLQMDGAESLLSTGHLPGVAHSATSSQADSTRTARRPSEAGSESSPSLPRPPPEDEDASGTDDVSMSLIEIPTGDEDEGEEGDGDGEADVELASQPSLTESARERFLVRVQQERLMGEGRWYRANRKGGAELLLLNRRKR